AGSTGERSGCRRLRLRGGAGAHLARGVRRPGAVRRPRGLRGAGDDPGGISLVAGGDAWARSPGHLPACLAQRRGTFRVDPHRRRGARPRTCPRQHGDRPMSQIVADPRLLTLAALLLAGLLLMAGRKLARLLYTLPARALTPALSRALAGWVRPRP